MAQTPYNPMTDGEQSSGGSALFAEVNVNVVLKYFISNPDLTSRGLTQDQTSFAVPVFYFDLSGEDDPRRPAQIKALQETKAKAEAWYGTHFEGGKKTPQRCIEISIPPSRVFGKQAGWKSTLIKTSSGMPAMHTNVPEHAKDIVRDTIIWPALLEAGVTQSGKYFMRFKYQRHPAQNPDLVEKPNTAAMGAEEAATATAAYEAERNKYNELLFVPVQTFKTEAEIREAANAFHVAAATGATSAGVGLTDYSQLAKQLGPTGVDAYDEATMTGLLPILIELLKKNTPPTQVASEYGLSVPYVVKLAAAIKG